MKHEYCREGEHCVERASTASADANHGGDRRRAASAVPHPSGRGRHSTRAQQPVQAFRRAAATEANLTLAATTQAIQDSIIYARTNGYLRRRFVDIGDR